MNSRITIRPVVLSQGRRADGSYNVKIRLTYKRVSRILPTPFTASEKEVTRKPPLRIKTGPTYSQAWELAGSFYKQLHDLPYAELEHMDVDDILRHLKNKLNGSTCRGHFHLDFFEWAERYAQTKSPSTADAYRCATAALARYLGKRELEITALSTDMIRGFLSFLKKEPLQSGRSPADGRKKKGSANAKKCGTERCYILRLQTIFLAAKDSNNDPDTGTCLIPGDPFSKLPKCPKPLPAHRSRDIAMFRKILHFHGECTAGERMALDLFLLSFGLMGMNSVDLLEVTPPQEGILEYKRKKTRSRRADEAYIAVRIDPRLHPIIERLQDSAPDRHWLLIHRLFRNRVDLTRFLNRHLRRWALRNGEKPFTFYTARHSWATIARNDCHADKATVDECLNHVGHLPMADVYIKKDWTILWDLNRQVLDRLFEG